MTPFITMKSLINEGLSDAMLLPYVGYEAIQLNGAEEALRQKHSPTMFPYIKVLKLDGHDTVSPANYPNLFKAATFRKRRLDGTFKDFRSN